MNARAWPRAPRRFATIVRALGRGRHVPPPALAMVAIAASAFYGAVMGSYRATEAGRWALVLYGTIKGPLLIVTTAALCVLPFFAMNAALGLRRDWPWVLRAIAAGQAALSIALASLAPLTRVAYVSGIDHRWAVLFNLGMFGVASLAGQRVIGRYYRALVRRSRWHAALLAVWLGMYGFVGIQTAWMLRPFIGTPGRDVTFLREEPFSNAYVALGELLAGASSGGAGAPDGTDGPAAPYP